MTTYKLADMGKWGEKAKRNTTMVMRSSVQKLATDLMEDTGRGEGQTPFEFGNLRNSLLASTAAMPAVRGGEDQEFSDPSGSITLTIATAKIGQTIWLGFQAAYARRLNHGFTGTDKLGRQYNQAGRFYVESKANKWQSYVDDAAAEFVD
jgi:hypothetical protein